MKEIKKETLDELIRVQRKYYKTSDVDILPLKNNICDELSEQAFNDEIKWIHFCDLVSAIINLYGQNTNQTFYEVFELIGIRVKASGAETKDANYLIFDGLEWQR